ncbi:Hsp33 family molecular chaperone HslO [Alicyclobacillus sp. SO9]|uniref:Hsp33 family molecular chaperone HslO n=1 Tax=Alicyclobacillus sp. SO9 TaxID=2665646 RepID=UPI0018E799B2|nr:Hsp33 family molecular chaperone HslO [Alicyclobacillus sp. SO9]QQE79429.1 Hsp33 family molecular chaperone HslO [Alicyclobacillus sp. SO9]
MTDSTDRALRAVSSDGTVRVFTCVTTNLVNELQRRHGSWPVATAALGRTASIAGMMGLQMKGDERLTVQIKGDGPLGTIMVDADSQGFVRGYVQNPHVHLPNNRKGKLNVGGGVGEGLLYVMRDMGLKDVYRGSSELQSGEIADDFTYYFAISEQTPSSVGAGVLVDTDNSVIVAGGFIIQLMPGHTEATIEKVERAVESMPSVTDLLRDIPTPLPHHLLERLLPDAQILEEHPLAFRCQCSRSKVENTLRSLGVAEINSMLEENGEAEVICHFCNEAYHFDGSELIRIRDSISL